MQDWPSTVGYAFQWVRGYDTSSFCHACPETNLAGLAGQVDTFQQRIISFLKQTQANEIPLYTYKTMNQ